jgi:hypothetical protein
MTFWYGSRSGDPYLSLTDPDPAILVSDLQDDNKNFFFPKFFFLFTFEAIFTSFFKDKSQRTVEIKVYLTDFG